MGRLTKFTGREGGRKRGRLKKLASAGVAAGLLLVTVVTGCGSQNVATGPAQTQGATTPQRGGTFINWMKDDPRSLDPAHCGDTQSYDIQMNIYDGLLTFDQSGKKVIPDLAAQMPTISNNGKTYTFELRKGIKFQNGDPLTADDVVYTFNRLAAKSTASEGEGYFSMIKGMDDVNQGKATTVSGVVKKGDYTVEFNLSAPNRTFLDVMALPYAFILDKKYTSALPNQADLSLKPMGTGPFKFVSWKRGQEIKLVRNQDYFMKDAAGRRLPYLDGITWKLGYDESVAFLKFKNKEQDYTWIPAADYVQVMNDPVLKKDVVSIVQNDFWYFAANEKVKPFDNKKLLLALEYGIDKEALLKLINNRGVIANGILPPNMPGYKQNPAGFKYDLAKAKSLMAEAGYANGLPGEYPVIYRQSQITNTLMVNIQAQLAKLGIKVKLDAVPFPQYLDVVTQGKATLLLGHWAQDYPDPDDFLNILFNTSQIPSNNLQCYSNPKVDAQLNQLCQEPDLEKAIPGYQAVEKTILQDGAEVPLYHDKAEYLLQPWVHAQLHPVFPYFYYLTAWIDQKAEKQATGK
ncbi:Solute-binding protein family 5 domain [Acididesulfobacillus acetoxydans]|uniref:Heme-binding protein A n=1 Tax=Acididesulfobacillus acetoxydans TaxID=1561005 RepID=A0A8S0W1P5_9FIRM|nr:ABC transporter substrate-binding protein [Acididesulfobacillus acetoxydans]CAA7599668.1 Solute-binding protein family 5 domain [Acididesulfobacillus acetoxydans]CEJ06220.1 Heme-binding protein A [Acididesulfobacillus acetoxydans]